MQSNIPEKLIPGLLENVSSRISMAIFEKLSKEDREKVLKFLKSGDSDAALKILNIKIDDFSGVVNKIASQTLQEFNNKC